MIPDQHIGLQAIGARIGVKAPRTIIQLARKDGLPIRRQRFPKGKTMWVLDEDLYTNWRMQRARYDRDELERLNLYKEDYPRPNRSVAAEQGKRA